MANNKDDNYNKRREEVEEIVSERFELQRKALRIVERLTETQIEEDFFKCCAEFLLPSHYADVVEERSIDKVCGYPLCDKPLEKMTPQKYHISMKSNKVYDMSERKCFCSQFCYKASRYYQAQVPTLPLWSRSKERFDEIKLLKKGVKPAAVTELPPDSMVVRLRVKEEEIESPPLRELEVHDYGQLEQEGGGKDDPVKDTSILSLNDSRRQRKRYIDFERAEAKQEADGRNRDSAAQTPSAGDSHVSLQGDLGGRSPVGEDRDHKGRDGREIEAPRTEIVKCAEDDVKHDKKSTGSGDLCEQDSRLEGSGITGVNEPCLKEKLKNGESKSERADKVNSVIYNHVIRCLMEWRTLRSVEFLGSSTKMDKEGALFGVDSITIDANNSKPVGNGAKLPRNSQEIETRSAVQVTGTESRDYTNSNEVEGSVRGKQLDVSRSEAGCEDDQNVGGVVSFAGINPTPDMGELRQRTERFNLKVKQFYSVRPDKLLPSEKSTKDEKATKSTKSAKALEEARPVNLPPVDSHSQMTIRRKIVLDKVHKVFRDLLPPLGVTLPDISADLRDLVMTFDLHSKNISFKPAGWTLVALCLLHLLAHRQGHLRVKLTSTEAVRFLAVIWKQYRITSEDLTGLVDRYLQSHGDTVTR